MIRFLHKSALSTAIRSCNRVPAAVVVRAMSTKPQEHQIMDQPDVEVVEQEAVEAATADDLPWYLREQVDVLTEREDVALPEVPSGAPESVSRLLRLVGHDYGLEDIQVFDLNTLDASHPHSTQNQPFDYIIIASGKSEKHIYKAGQELKHFLKHEYSKQARINGLVSAAPSPVARRRMLKRANKAPAATDNNYGLAANSWVMCETFVDNVCVHFLTKERREELNLEALWVEEQPETDSYDQMIQQKDSKNVPPFFLSRRYLHVSATSFNAVSNSSAPETVFKKVKDTISSKVTDELVSGHIKEFEANFSIQSSPDYQLKTDFYRTLHLVAPKVVTLTKVSDVMLEKYADLGFSVAADLKKERVKDLVTYMKILLDSPEVNVQPPSKSTADRRYDLLSKFTSNLYRLTGDTVDLGAVPEIIPLLWKLAFVAKTQYPELGSSIIDQTIYENKDTSQLQFNTDTLAENRARDITDLIDYYINLNPQNVQLSTSVKELQLFSYGNAGEWSQFWKSWNAMNLVGNKDDIKRWIRLIVYLALRNDASANTTFLKEYFLSSTQVSGSFISDFKARFHQLSTAERAQLKRSLLSVLESSLSSQTLAKTDEIRSIIEAL